MREVIADHDLTHSLVEWIPLAIAAAIGLGWLIGSLARGRTQGMRDALETAETELGVLKTARDRFRSEVDELRETTARLEGIVEQLQRENRSLRELVMLESIPPPLQAVLDETRERQITETERLHIETRERIIAELNDAERRVTELMNRARGG